MHAQRCTRVFYGPPASSAPGHALNSWKAPGIGFVLIQQAGSPDAAALCLLFTQHIRYGLRSALTQVSAGRTCVWGGEHVYEPLSWSTPLPRPTLCRRIALMRLSDGNFMPSPPTHTVNITFRRFYWCLAQIRILDCRWRGFAFHLECVYTDVPNPGSQWVSSRILFCLCARKRDMQTLGTRISC